MEALPQEGGTVEVFSVSLETWIPATVTAIVDEKDHYEKAGRIQTVYVSRRSMFLRKRS